MKFLQVGDLLRHPNVLIRDNSTSLYGMFSNTCLVNLVCGDKFPGIKIANGSIITPTKIGDTKGLF